jgi:hypothetical protein
VDSNHRSPSRDCRRSERLRRDHRAKYGCLSARPRVRCLSLPGKNQHLLPKSVFDDPGLIAGTWHRPLFLTRDRWFESGSLQRGVMSEPQPCSRVDPVRCRSPRWARPDHQRLRWRLASVSLGFECGHQRVDSLLTNHDPLSKVCYRRATGRYMLTSRFTARDPKLTFANGLCDVERGHISG